MWNAGRSVAEEPSGGDRKPTRLLQFTPSLYMPCEVLPLRLRTSCGTGVANFKSQLSGITTYGFCDNLFDAPAGNWEGKPHKKIR